MSTLANLKRKASRQGWSKWIKNETDEQAVLEGCYFDQASADRVRNFFRLCLRHTDGVWANQPFELLDWEDDALARLFGWKRADGFRRFRQAGIWVPKKNGKTELCSGLVIYTLMADGEPSAEIYSVANCKDQASKIFLQCKKMIECCDLEKHVEPIDSKTRIVFPRSNSFYQVLASKPQNVHGWNIHACYFDELHEQKDPELFNSLRWGGAARRQPLFVTISTAGVYEPEGIAWQQWKYARDVEQGVIKDTSFLPVIYAAEPDDDWNDEKTWHKANPSLGHTIQLDDYRRDYQEAKARPSQQAWWQRHRLNMWTQAATTWIPDDRWMTCSGSTDLDEDELQDIQWFGGLDLANTIDIAAFVMIGKYDDRWIIKPTYWVNEEQARLRQERDGVSYLTWCRQGFIRMTEGNTIDYDVIRRDINELADMHNIRQIAVDRWNASQIVTQLQGDGFDIAFYGMGYKDQSPPTKELERLVYAGELVHDCPVLRWMLSNVAVMTDAAGNIKITRDKSTEKIDGIAALIMAIGISMTPDEESPYEHRGLIVL